MGYFLSDFEIREIKDRLNIVDLIEHYVSLTKSGSQYRGLCPFHDDKNPSLNVNEEKGLFHCFSCGSGGDMFGFYMRYNNISFSEAALELAKRAGVSINSSGVSDTKKSPKEPLYRFNTFAAELYHSFLTHSPGAQSAREYLKGRGLSIEAAKEFQLGFAPDRWDFLFEELKHKNMPLKHAQELGLIVRKKSGDGYYDMFRNRVVFPIKDIEGRVVGFGGRTLGGDEPKYINSPESPVYHKGRVLYGLDNARDAIRRTKTAVVVEGYMDCLALHSAGMKNALATLGTSLTAEHAGLLKRLAKDAVLVFDGDSSGAKASMRALKVFLNEGLSPRMVVLPHGDDPDSFISRTSHN